MNMSVIQNKNLKNIFNYWSNKITINLTFQRRSMKEKRKYKWFSIEKITGERWHIGAFIASDDFNQFYLMIALVKWDIYIGKIVDWDSMW